MAYMKWVAAVREAAREQEKRGMLGVLAARTKIHEGRLRDWLTKNTIDDLGYSEISALHDALGESIEIVEAIKNDSPNPKEPGGPLDPHKPQQCGCRSCEDNDISFDQSD